ncbi:MAG: GDSL-type esterase/lipase family protein [Nitrospirota bacterium]|nr:GDSL-type esterase/lipase family protein [Nitrospirota bacterium]
MSRLSRQMDISILNKGRNGETTRSALSRLEQDVLDQDPRIVILLLGGNDAIRRLPQKETFDNLAQMIDRIQQTGAAVVLVGV